MKVECFTNGPFKQNCYLLFESDARCLIIDPGSDAESIQQRIQRQAATPVAIINTHGHFDHIGAVDELKTKYGIPFYCHAADRKLIKRANLYQLTFLAEQSIVVPQVDEWLGDEQVLKTGSFSVEVLHTPGHTPGSVCLLINGTLFTGDTLLAGTVGRVDLPGGDAEALHASLRRLASLDPALAFFGGHGPGSTIGDELKTNQRFAEALHGNRH